MGEVTLEQQIELLHRTPFRTMLAQALRISPTEEALQKFADKCPDRYWQMVTMIAKLTGYGEAPKVIVNAENHFYFQLQQSSDSELAAMADEAMRKLMQQQALPHDPEPTE